MPSGVPGPDGGGGPSNRYGAPPKQGGGGGKVVVGIVLVALLGLGCCGLGTVSMLLSDSPSATKKKKKKKKKKSKKKSKSKASIINGDLSTLGLADVRPRVERKGWTVLGNPSEQSGTSGSWIVMSVSKGSKGGVVSMHNYNSLSGAKALEKTNQEKPDAAVCRDGRKVLSVIVTDDRDEATRTLKAIIPS